jgi:hypothetical protein
MKIAQSNKYALIKTVNHKVYIHGVASSVSVLTHFYYKYRKQYGYMEIVDRSNHVLATLGSKVWPVHM